MQRGIKLFCGLALLFFLFLISFMEQKEIAPGELTVYLALQGIQYTPAINLHWTGHWMLLFPHNKHRWEAVLTEYLYTAGWRSSSQNKYNFQTVQILSSPFCFFLSIFFECGEKKSELYKKTSSCLSPKIKISPKSWIYFRSQPHQSVRETVKGKKNFNQDLAGKVFQWEGKYRLDCT